MTAAPRISIIIPLFNHLRETRAMLASLLDTLEGREDYEIILADDGSADGTGEWLDSLAHPRIQVFRNAVNCGYARTNNAAIRRSRGELLVLANNDLVFGANWLQPMLDALCNPALKAGVVGNVQLAVADGQVDHAGIDVSYRGQLSHIRCLAASEAKLDHAERFAVTGACCMLRRDVFDAVGGLDERYVNGGEDVDLCFKLSRRGLVHYVALRSVVRHHVSLSRGASRLQNERNSELLACEWGALLEQRLAARWLERLRTGALSEPSEGHDDLGLDPARVPVPAELATPLARCALQRLELHRRAFLSMEAIRPQYSSIRAHGAVVASDLAGYVHSHGDLVFNLPAGVGFSGFFVHGHLFSSDAFRSAAQELWAVLEINLVQRTEVRLTGGDFIIGFHRPLLWQDAPSSARLRLEGRDPASGRPVPVPASLYADLYLKQLALDDGVELPLARIRIASDELPGTTRTP